MRSLLCLLCVAAVARADDVSQFRGPGGRAASAETGLPTTWSATENVRWKAPLPGRGLSNPVVAGGRVYVTACTGPDQRREHVLCFDLATGKRLWERSLWATGGTLCHPKTNMAAPTPIAAGDRVYALFATGDLVCYDRDGDLVWYRSLVGDYPTVGNNVGMAASPAFHDGLVLVCLENVGESFLAGVDAATGVNRWRVDRPRGINWVTPLVVEGKGRADVVVQGPRDLTAYDVATGRTTWSMTDHGLSTIPSPTVGDGLIFTAGDKFLAVRPGRESTKPEVVWQSPKLRPGYSSPLFHRGRVYTVATGGIVHCADAATGKIVWTHRLEGAYAASPLAADGKLYVVNEDGVTTVLDPAGAEPTVLATNPIGDKILATPVAADGAILLRSDGHLYCIGASRK